MFLSVQPQLALVTRMYLILKMEDVYFVTLLQRILQFQFVINVQKLHLDRLNVQMEIVLVVLVLYLIKLLNNAMIVMLYMAYKME